MYIFKPVAAICLLFFTISLSAQVAPKKDSATDDSKIFSIVESEASFPGGDAGWRKMLEKNMNGTIPTDNGAPAGKYKVIVRFIVNKEGVVSDIKPETNLGYGMEAEVMRVIKKSGSWIPAMQNNKPVNAYRRQPITFMIATDNFEITTKEPFTLFTNTDNELTVSAGRIKAQYLSIIVPGGKVTPVSDGKFIVRINKPGRVTIDVINTKKEDKVIGSASFEVKAN